MTTRSRMMFAVRDDNGTLMWTKSCRPTEVGLAAEFMYSAFEFVKLATYSVLPFVVILTLNVAIVVRLRHTAAPLPCRRRRTRQRSTDPVTVIHLSAVGIGRAEHDVVGGDHRHRQSTTSNELRQV